jgi:hypothetical protein
VPRASGYTIKLEVRRSCPYVAENACKSSKRTSYWVDFSAPFVIVAKNVSSSVEQELIGHYAKVYNIMHR